MISEEAISYIKNNKKNLIEDFASIESFPKDVHPVSIFMAGSAGAGKTEISKALVRIYHNEIKEWIPQYTGKNSDEISGASYIGVEKLYDSCLRKNQNLVLDGTLSNLGKSRKNIKRSIDKKRLVEVYYLFQDPVTSWDFTKKRGAIDGRIIPKDFFINSFLLSQENAKKIKDEFGELVSLNIIIKNYNHGLDRFELNVSDITPYLNKTYTKDELEDIIS